MTTLQYRYWLTNASRQIESYIHKRTASDRQHCFHSISFHKERRLYNCCSIRRVRSSRCLQPALNHRQATLPQTGPQRLMSKRSFERFPNRAYVHERTFFPNGLG